MGPGPRVSARACTLVHIVCPSFSDVILSQPRMHSNLTTEKGGEVMADWTTKRATPRDDIHTSEIAMVQSITLEKQASAWRLRCSFVSVGRANASGESGQCSSRVS